MLPLATYTDVNNAWGGATLPPITRHESHALFEKLIAKFGTDSERIGRCRVPAWCRRPRKVWASPKPRNTLLHVNGGHNGLPRMIHDASHIVFEWKHPGKKTHSVPHAELEWEMIAYAMSKGWHLPKVEKAKPTLAEKHAAELLRLAANEKRWLSKAKRAKTALAKIAKRRKYIERRAAC